MTTANNQAQAVANLRDLCKRAVAQDDGALKTVTQIKARSEAGDPKSKIAWKGLQYLYWIERTDKALWTEAENLYDRIAAREPQAVATLKGILASAKRGEKLAVAALGRLKAIHGQHKPNALFPAGPGQARFGGYGMPEVNVAGVVIGGATGVAVGGLSSSQAAAIKSLISRALSNAQRNAPVSYDTMVSPDVPTLADAVTAVRSGPTLQRPSLPSTLRFRPSVPAPTQPATMQSAFKQMVAANATRPVAVQRSFANLLIPDDNTPTGALIH